MKKHEKKAKNRVNSAKALCAVNTRQNSSVKSFRKFIYRDVSSWEPGLSKVERWRAVDTTGDCGLKIASHSLSDYVAMRLRPLSVRPRLLVYPSIENRVAAGRCVATTAPFCPTHPAQGQKLQLYTRPAETHEMSFE